jgi:YHS domain-containing protein
MIRKTLLLGALFISFNLMATDPIYTVDGVAITGYDPVAYFTEHKPVEGKKEHSYTWKNSEWHFSSAENLALFKADPEKYAPQFGGYCAFGMSRGYAAKTDPTAWKVLNEKLYLNYNAKVRAKWLGDLPAIIDRAEKHWPKVLAKD